MTADDLVDSGNLEIHLGSDHVGDLLVRGDGRSEFSLSSSYRKMYPRPVLGQTFEDDLGQPRSVRRRLPAFFSNLLPEERLRSLVAEQLGVSEVREPLLLAYLGEDLPGAVRVVPQGDLPSISSSVSHPSDPAHLHPIKFSLAGMQPKLSMLVSGDGLTFPATGLGGDWIVKMPSPAYAGVPENEMFTMTWARESGISVSDFRLVPVAQLENLPPAMRGAGGMAFAIRRFDRPTAGSRIHIEDFAQVLDVYPQDKYKAANYETVASIIRRLDSTSFDEFLRRLVFVVMSANADAHLKNWSLWYPDRIHPQLSPAYDLVSTVEFIPEDRLALNLDGSKEWGKINLESFASLAQRVGADPESVSRQVTGIVSATREAFQRVRSSASRTLIDRLEAHWKQVPLASSGA